MRHRPRRRRTSAVNGSWSRVYLTRHSSVKAGLSVLLLDGSESFYTHKNVRGDEAWLLASRVRRVEATIEIATVTTRAGADRTGSWDSLWTLSLNAEGQLVIVRSEPTLQGTNATLKAVYRKK